MRKITIFKNIGFLGMVGGLASIMAAASVVSCSTGNYLSENDLRDVINGENKRIWYYFTGGGLTQSWINDEINMTYDATRSNLLRIETKHDDLNEIASIGAGDILKFKQSSKKPIAKIKFDLADQVILTSESGLVTTIKTEAELNRIYNETELIKKAKKIAFHIRDNVFWATADGIKTNYKIKPSDFIYTVNRQQLQSDDFRLKHGGNPELEMITTGLGATHNKTWRNHYLYNLFGYDLKKMLWSPTNTEPENNLDISNNKTGILTFYTNLITPQSRNLSHSFRTFFATSGVYAPEPSSYISSNKFQASKFRYTHSSAYKVPAEPTGVVAKYGYYRYGQTNKDALYGGPYRGQEDDRTRRRIVVNENYWDKAWVKRKDTVRSYTQDFIPAQDLKIFAKSKFEQYKFKRIWRIKYNEADINTQNEIKNAWKSADINQFGARYGKIVEKNRTTFKYDHALTTRSGRGGKKVALSDYLISENYAKIQYGNSLTDISNNTSKTTNQTLISALGSGRSFQSIIDAAINWVTIANIVDTNGTQQPWLIATSPETLLKPGPGQEELIKYNESINTLTAYGYNATTKLLDESKKVVVTPTANALVYKNNTDNINKAIKSAKYAELKVMMKNLLDQLQISGAGSVKFPTFNVDTFESGPQKQVARNYIIALVNGLDSRLAMYNYRKTEDNNAEFITGISQYDWFGWTADYDGIGGMIAGWLMVGAGFGRSPAFLQIFANLLTNETELKTIYPEMIALAKSLKIRYQQFQTKFPGDLIDFSEFTKIRGNDFRDEAIGFKVAIIDVLGKNFHLDRLYKTSEQAALAKMRERINVAKALTDPEKRYLAKRLIQADIKDRFWDIHGDLDGVIGLEMLSYQEKQTVSQLNLKDLIKEMEQLVVPMVGAKPFIPRRDQSPILVYQNYITKPIDPLSKQIFLRDWRIGDRSKY